MTAIIFIDTGGPVEVEYMGTFFSAQAVDFGEDESNRLIVCAVHVTANQSSDATLQSGTLGGAAISVLAGDTESPGHPNSGDIGVYLISAAPTGTSGASSFTFSSTSGLGYQIAAWRVTNLHSHTPIDTASQVVFNASSPHSINADAQAEGAFFGAAMLLSQAGDAAITAGVTEDYNANSLNLNASQLGGHALISADESNRPLTMTHSSGLVRGVMAAVSFR